MPILDTAIGPVTLTVQSARNLYVRTEGEQVLDLGHAQVTLNGHFYVHSNGAVLPWREDATWKVARYLSLHRQDRRDLDVTEKQTERIILALGEALAIFARDNPDALTQADDERRHADAAKKREEAASLIAIAAHLRIEAEALENGAKLEWREVSYTSGFSEKIRVVGLGNGQYLDPPVEPNVSGTVKHYHHRDAVREMRPAE